MQILSRKDLPLDHTYYRTSSELYNKYLWKCWLKIHYLSENIFGWIKDIFWFFQVAKFERVDIEPDVETLKRNWFRHGFIIWIPYSRVDIPKWWRKLWLNSHFTTTWFTQIENEFYYKKWKDRAKRARKKFLENQNLRIDLVDTETFQKHYKEAKISQPYKSDFMRYHRTISNLDEKQNIKNMICSYNGKVVAWLAVINYNENSSAHLVSFLTKDWKVLQAGTGLIDFWFQYSLKHGIKYINFDHLKDKHMGRDQQWYTDFKENFMEYKVVFEDSYFKII